LGRKLIDTVTCRSGNARGQRRLHIHLNHLLDGCQAFGKTSYHLDGASGGRAKRTMAICRATANNGRFWFINEKGTGTCARERHPDEPPRAGWRVSSYSSGAGPAPRLEW